MINTDAQLMFIDNNNQYVLLTNKFSSSSYPLPYSSVPLYAVVSNNQHRVPHPTMYIHPPNITQQNTGDRVPPLHDDWTIHKYNTPTIKRQGGGEKTLQLILRAAKFSRPDGTGQVVHDQSSGAKNNTAKPEKL